MWEGLTEQQRKWMASVRQSIETRTGRSLGDWIEIARACPETKPRARVRWFKDVHGLGQNYTLIVLDALDEANGVGGRDAATLEAALWKDDGTKAILAALQAAVADLPDVVTGQRKTFTSWSRKHAFAAARPMRDGKVRLGLALDPDADPRLESPRNEAWSERLISVLLIATPDEATDARQLLRAAWERS